VNRTKIEWCDYIELFLPQFESWTRRILHICSQWDDRIFIFLTKQPQNLIKFSPFPDNCWVGVTATNANMFRNAIFYLGNIKASVKYISFEPLLDSVNAPDQKGESSELDYNFNLNVIDWLIINAQTNPYKPPEIEWVREIVEAADKAGILVFLKDNLAPLLVNCEAMELYSGFFKRNDEGDLLLRQEMPEIK
jgi:protein gp37